ncbi:dTDP-4-dehydrorhamnose 3,5-epimerase [Pararhodobacter oceanensis]|uniref:dTDP-4-dehydrorhamnose 3,5-epimerase n=1 Tax=Pararhodobacter oceanensis TaxID=2172121 RepID=UPI003A95C905
MQIDPTQLDGVLLLTPRRFGDARGFFAETWNEATLREAGLHLPHFVQDNHSFSAARGTVRGLHYQAPPVAQGKLVRCARGRLMDVAVDVRRGSKTYGQWIAEELSFENGRQLWIPAGFLHGFATLEPDTEIAYKCTARYAPEVEGAVHFNDPDLAIDWGVDLTTAVVSEKDAAAAAFADWTSPFTMEGV